MLCAAERARLPSSSNLTHAFARFRVSHYVRDAMMFATLQVGGVTGAARTVIRLKKKTAKKPMNLCIINNNLCVYDSEERECYERRIRFVYYNGESER
jgi:hypothetical protein